VLDNPFSGEIFPNIQSKHPLTQLEVIASHPIASYLGEEVNTCLTTTSFQVVVESEEVSPQPPLLQTEQPQLLQSLPIRLVLQTPLQPRCPSLDMLQPLSVLLGVRGPKLNTALEVWPHQCRYGGYNPPAHTHSTQTECIHLKGEPIPNLLWLPSWVARSSAWTGSGNSAVAHLGGRCPIPGNIPDQVGLGSEQPDPVEDVSAYGR